MIDPNDTIFHFVVKHLISSRVLKLLIEIGGDLTVKNRESLTALD
jgi:hypothetical protein